MHTSREEKEIERKAANRYFFVTNKSNTKASFCMNNTQTDMQRWTGRWLQFCHIRHRVQTMSSLYRGPHPDPGFPRLGLVNMTTYKDHICQESAFWLSKFPCCISVLLNKCLQVPFLVSGWQHTVVFILMGTCGHSISFWIVDIRLQV